MPDEKRTGLETQAKRFGLEPETVGYPGADIGYWKRACHELTHRYNQAICAFVDAGNLLKSQNERMAELLAELEWAGDGQALARCPTCEALKESGHKPDCRLNAILAELRGVKP